MTTKSPRLPDDSAGVSRADKERRLGQRGCVIWLFGLSGAGKSTLATALERRLAAEGRMTFLLDGDRIRAGLNRGLGFGDEDRAENLRRAAEVARLLVEGGVIVIGAFITPLRAHRRLVREIIGDDDLLSFHLSASFGACAARDPKGLYAGAAAGSVRQFTGKDSRFEPPDPDEGATVIDSERQSVAAAVDRLHGIVLPRIQPA